MCKAGLGITRLPRFYLGNELETGELIELFVDYPKHQLGAYMVTQVESTYQQRCERLKNWSKKRSHAMGRGAYKLGLINAPTVSVSRQSSLLMLELSEIDG
ncbi:hypothetical protein [Vibrio sp. 10N]|uniref:hypothetical protein n=1 Tax=Vibrio sp. 10N TaxID=3058938 RepID=UPI0030C6DA39